MTPQEIRSTIEADADLLAMASGEGTDYAAIAAALTASHTRTVQTLGGVGYVMRVLGPTAGAAVLDALDALRSTNSAVKWGFILLDRGDLDFGDPGTQAMIEQLAQMGAITQSAADALIAATQVPDVVTIEQVAEAMR